jgi:surface-anchored protein
MTRISAAFFSVLFVVVSMSQVASADIAHYYTEGHADLGLGDGDTLELHFHGHADDAYIDGEYITEDAEYEPGQVVIVVPESTKNYVHSSGGANAFVSGILGINQGEDYWFLPQSVLEPGGSSQLHAPSFGLGAEDITLNVFDGNSVSLTLLGMAGPAEAAFALERNGVCYMTTADEISASDIVGNFPVGGHEHFSFYFTKAGDYELTFQASAYVNGSLVTDENTYHFQVVPEPSSLIFLAPMLLGIAGFCLKQFRSR